MSKPTPGTVKVKAASPQARLADSIVAAGLKASKGGARALSAVGEALVEAALDYSARN